MPDLGLGTITPTTLEITITGGLPVTLPAAAPPNAGLMTADDKEKLDLIDSGSFTPSITGPATSYTPLGFRFIKIRDIIHGGGCVQITGCTVGGNSFVFDLPINTTVSSQSDVTGTVSGINVGEPAVNYGNYVMAYFSAGSMASVSFTATDTTATVYIEFTYLEH